MIVVAIIGILAAIAIPNFITYSMMARRGEVLLLMGGIRNNEESFLSYFDEYEAVNTPDPPLPFGPAKRAFTGTHCSPTCQKSQPFNCLVFDCMGAAASGLAYYSYNTDIRHSAALVSPEFTIGAAGDVDSDGRILAVTFQSGNGVTVGVVANPWADVSAACPVGAPISEVFICTPGFF
jgi:type II secretory pathway pseudopilin PulG